MISKYQYNRSTKSFSITVGNKTYASAALYRSAMNKALDINDPRAEKFMEAYKKARKEELSKFNPETIAVLENHFYQQDKMIFTKIKKLPYNIKINKQSLYIECHFSDDVLYVMINVIDIDKDRKYFMRKSQLGDNSTLALRGYDRAADAISSIKGDTRIIPFTISNEKDDLVLRGAYCDATDELYGTSLKYNDGSYDGAFIKDCQFKDVCSININVADFLKSIIKIINPKTRLR